MNKSKPAIVVMRKVVEYLNHSREDINQIIYDPTILIRMCNTIWSSGYDLYPDQLTEGELNMAILGKTAKLKKLLEERLG